MVHTKVLAGTQVAESCHKFIAELPLRMCRDADCSLSGAEACWKSIVVYALGAMELVRCNPSASVCRVNFMTRPFKKDSGMMAQKQERVHQPLIRNEFVLLLGILKNLIVAVCTGLDESQE